MIENIVLAATSPYDWRSTTLACLLFPVAVTYIITFLSSQRAIYSRSKIREPPKLPYILPGLGNTVSFATNTEAYYAKATATFGKYMPVRIKVLSSKFYLLTGADNIANLFRNSKDFSTGRSSVYVLTKAFGVPEGKDAQFLEADDSGINVQPELDATVTDPDRRIWRNLHASLHEDLAGKALRNLADHFVDFYEQQMEKLTQIDFDSWTYIPDLYEFMKREIFVASTTALMGPHIFRLNPTVVEDFWNFDSNIMYLFKQYPKFAAPRAYAARDKICSDIQRYLEHAESNLDIFDPALDDVQWEPYLGSKLMRSRQRMFHKTGVLSMRHHAANNLGMLWATNANAIPASFWMLLCILTDPSLFQRSVNELAPHLDPAKPVDLAAITALPLMQAIYSEVLRLTISSFITRFPKHDFNMGEWLFKSDGAVLMSTWHAGREALRWNQGSSDNPHPVNGFWADRWLSTSGGPAPDGQNKSGETSFTPYPKPGVYFPYGGGAKICPGRHFAKQEMIGVTVMMLRSFEFEFVDVEAASKAKPDMKYFGFGVMPPVQGEHLKVRVRRRRG